MSPVEAAARALRDKLALKHARANWRGNIPIGLDYELADAEIDRMSNSEFLKALVLASQRAEKETKLQDLKTKVEEAEAELRMEALRSNA